MSKPRAILISDIHYNINTLPLADAALRQAVTKANELNVPLIVTGDLHDTKANIRGECINAMLSTFGLCKQQIVVLRGNHDAINEKSQAHSLNFLHDIVHIVDYAQGLELNDNYYHFIPYFHNVAIIRHYLEAVPEGSTIFMHQGIAGSDSGEYIQDKSALDPTDVSNFRVISGHYHRRQDIRTGRPRRGAIGLFSYVGNPFTLNYGEASHPSKGYQILKSDGLLEHVPTNLRKHIVYEFNASDIPPTGIGFLGGIEEDLVWIKITGTREQLANLTKSLLSKEVGLENFRFDLIPTDNKSSVSEEIVANKTQPEILDKLIDSTTNASDEAKERLKALWRGLV